MTDFGLADKVVIITGGAGGLGRAFASAFLQAGARVTIADIDEAGARAAAAAIGPSAKFCIPHAVDITDEASIARMTAHTLDAFGSIDVLVNNAALYGAAYRKPFFDISASGTACSP
jgi:NAD(P)-dependent dehydrogenase (short-subunit alcohol dehydrogenase family)